MDTTGTYHFKFRRPTIDFVNVAGTLALRGAKLGTEASIVSKLRRAGAIVLGKANLSEWANFRGTGGWSAIGGKCVGPYVDNQDPQGSSCGSAVAVRLGLCTAAIGTEVLPKFPATM
jgi:amidase